MLDNVAIAELLVAEAETAEGHRQRAFRRAARAAFMWPEEASDVAAAGRPLTELAGIGPALNKRLQAWLEVPPTVPTPPAIRSEFMTRAQARKILAKKPAWRSRLRGDLQMHSEWSDGSATIAEMAAAGMERSYEYIAITDHTKGLKIAGGLDEARLAQQGEEIVALNEQLREDGNNFSVLRAAEMNLSPDGRGDMEPSALADLDLVLGCFHSALRRKNDQTERYLAGIRNPDIQILGHPQTRIYNYREGLHADWRKVFAEAARLDKAVEIDGDPNRQDLRLSLLKLARAEGCRISLGTDAHGPEQFAYMDLALAAALMAKIPPEQIVSFLPLAKLKSWVASVRASARSTR
jgi:histidinol phosphatase-like PHP family hydrolase